MSNGGSPKVLVITQYFPPESQGGAHRWQKLIEHTSEKYSFHVVCPPPSVPFGEHEPFRRLWAREMSNGIPVTRLWSYQPQTRHSLARIVNYSVFSVLASLYVACFFWRFDCIVTVSTPHTTFLPGLVGKLLGRTWVLDIYDSWLDNAVEFDYIDAESLPYKLIAILERLAIAKSDTVFVITDTLGGHYLDKYDVSAAKFKTLPFGINQQQFTPDAADEQPRIVYLGNLGTFYEFEPFLRGFARIDERYEFHFVGSGEHDTALKELTEELGIADRVTFTGPVPRSSVPEKLAAAKLSIIPLEPDTGLEYAFPTKLIESMAVGTPYVSYDIREITTVTNEFDTGAIVEPDSEDIAETFRQLVSEEDYLHTLGDNAREYIETNHDWSKLGSTVEREISDAVAG